MIYADGRVFEGNWVNDKKAVGVYKCQDEKGNWKTGKARFKEDDINFEWIEPDLNNNWVDNSFNKVWPEFVLPKQAKGTKPDVLKFAIRTLKNWIVIDAFELCEPSQS